jgi:hypothetical protein
MFSLTNFVNISKLTCLTFFVGCSLLVQAQQLSIKGVVRDNTGELLPFAHVIITPDSATAITDEKGKFSVKASRGLKLVLISYTGYHQLAIQFSLKGDTILNFSLTEKVDQLKEVVVRSQKYSQLDWIETTRSGTTTLTPKEITGLPVLGGESDVIKVLQLLPGTVRGVEGSSDLFVRGGAADQNLVLLDDVPIYNTSHLFGFISVFNPDILENVESVNGGFPAHYGGRLSSVLNIETRSGISKRTNVAGNVGLLASRLMIEQPIVKNKLSVWVSGRRTYIDQVVKAVDEELPYYFYDLNGKVIFTPTNRDNIEVVAYGGKDILNIFRDRNNDGDGFLTSYQSGNNSQVIRWQHKFKNEWASKFSAYRTEYEYRIFNSFEDSRLLSASDIVDVGAKVQFNKNFTGLNSSTIIGVDWVRHSISPSVFNTTGTIAELFESNSSSGRVANEIAAHGQYEWNLNSKWTLNTGLRAVMTVVPNDIYFIPEPRISARYSLGKSNALKFNYSRMAQFIHRISNSAVTSPTDIWYPVTDSIRPQTSHQVSVAWQRYYGGSKKLYVSVEGYYKYMNDLIGFEEGTNLFFNTDFESKLIQGKGSAYGVEFLVKKETGKLTGWVSYTLSWATRNFDDLNNGKTFPSRYDRRHNGAVVAQYALGKRWALSAVWEFISGSRFTPVIGQYLVAAPTGVGVDLLPQYAPLNSVRLADTHRLDLGIKFKNKPESKFQYEWFAGVYNAYNRASPIGINVTQDDNTGALKYEQPGLFGLLPFISYGFKF